MANPKRIVSLVPSTTETLFALGVGHRVVGVTRFCAHPHDARDRARVVGGTKNPRIETILALAPDLILANQEENRREDVERLQEHVPVEVFYPRDVAQAVADIRSLGRLVEEPENAEAIARDIERECSALRPLERGQVRYLYFIWRRPYMVAGPSTFIEALLAEAGFVNRAPVDRGRYPEMEPEEIRRSDADVFLLASEPFPFEEKHLGELGERSVLADGELLSWHGARLREGLPYVRVLAERFSSTKSTSSARPSPDPSP
ncbi:MAG TPA: helical backbone metal receptor [Vicinamibacteria bacterium]|nr:helical backbone metal receptor [Vicinamibacteria bacterium]